MHKPYLWVIFCWKKIEM